MGDKNFSLSNINIVSHRSITNKKNIGGILNSQCFNDNLSEEAIDEFNRGFALIHQTMVEGLK